MRQCADVEIIIPQRQEHRSCKEASVARTHSLSKAVFSIKSNSFYQTVSILTIQQFQEQCKLNFRFPHLRISVSNVHMSVSVAIVTYYGITWWP